jgi:hypothetical protein
MLTYDELRYHASKFLALSGLTVKEFKGLLPKFAQAIGLERYYWIPSIS